MPGGLGLEPRGPVQTRRVQGLGLGLGLGPLVCFRWRPDWMPPIMKKPDLSRAGGCKVWAGSGSRLVVLIEIEPCWRPWSFEPGGRV